MKTGKRLSGILALLAVSLCVTVSAKAEYFDDALLTYRHGEYLEAFSMFEKLAKQGDARAQFWIGTMWYQGKGKPQNYREAFRWYLRSAYAGNADGENNLGLIYQKGEAQPANPVVAYAWFSLAAAQNNDVARRNLDNLTDDMKQKRLDDKILEGQALAQEYLARIDAERRSQRVAVAPPATGRVGTGPQTLSSGVGVNAAPVPHRNMADAQEMFMVQLGLFEKAENVKRMRHALRKHGYHSEDVVVEIRGHTYERFRIGPYATAQAAQAAAQTVNRQFNLQSAVIPLLR